MRSTLIASTLVSLAFAAPAPQQATPAPSMARPSMAMSAAYSSASSSMAAKPAATGTAKADIDVEIIKLVSRFHPFLHILVQLMPKDLL